MVVIVVVIDDELLDVLVNVVSGDGRTWRSVRGRTLRVVGILSFDI